MNIEVGNKEFPVWLLGDSNPKNWQDVLITPLDPRHLLHTSISRGRFIESHNQFFEPDGNYFDFAGTQIADLFLKNSSQLNIWIW
jgi:hypothetical protein